MLSSSPVSNPRNFYHFHSQYPWNIVVFVSGKKERIRPYLITQSASYKQYPFWRSLKHLIFLSWGRLCFLFIFRKLNLKNMKTMLELSRITNSHGWEAQNQHRPLFKKQVWPLIMCPFSKDYQPVKIAVDFHQLTLIIVLLWL